MKKNVLFVMCLTLLALQVQAAGDSTLNAKDSILFARDTSFQGKYFVVGLGSDNVKMRDFATSPLFYQGGLQSIKLGYLRMTEKREVQFNASYSFGVLVVDEADIEIISQMKYVDLYYSRLYPLKNPSTGLWNFWAGGSLQVSGNLRLNPSLQNNANGVEIFNTVSGVFKIGFDASRFKNKKGKFLGLAYSFIPRKRELQFRIAPAVMNNTYRPGYIYSNMSPIVGDPNLFEDYKFSAFSGYRLSTSFDYLIYLRNDNIIRFSYLWDGATTGGDLDKFEMLHRIFQFSLIVNLK